jgi:plasmid stability protein
VKTACLTIRQCPLDLHSALKTRAQKNRRTLNAETIEVLAGALAANGQKPGEAELLHRIHALPSGRRMTLQETRAAIQEGRK